MRKEYIQSAKNGVGKVAKTGQHGGKQHAPKQRADRGKKSRDTPLSGKEKGDTVLPGEFRKVFLR
jgi:hypothetical protein